MSEVADVLDKAVDVLETYGWGQGAAIQVDTEGKVTFCAVGAIRKAANYIDNRGWTADIRNYELSMTTEDELGDYLNEDIPAWNDHPARDKFEVIDAMKSLAKDLRNRGNS